MNKIAIKIAILLSLAFSCTAYAQENDKLFPYPPVPEEMTTLSQRCNYLTYHFWERCNIKDSFLYPEKLNQAFGDWVSFMPYATSDTVHMSIDKYLADVAKTKPENLLAVARMAQGWLYSDTTEYLSEELFLPFCKAVAENKKVNKAEKARYQAQTVLLENSRLGAVIPNFQFTTPEGEKKNFNEVVSSRIILFFNDPDCIDCTFTKAKLAADYYLNKLIESKLVTVVAIYPSEPDDNWKTAAAAMPDTWVVGAAPDIDLLIDITDIPTLYYLDARHKVLAKKVMLDNLLKGIEGVYRQMSN